MAPSLDETSPDARGKSNATTLKPDLEAEQKLGSDLRVAAFALGKALMAELARLAHWLQAVGGSFWRWLRLFMADIWRSLRPLGRSGVVRAHELLQRLKRGQPAVPSQTGARQRQPSSQSWRRTRMLAFGFLAVVSVGAVITAVVIIWAVRDMPLADILPALEEPRLEIVTAEGETLYSRGAYRAAYVALPDLPENLISAVVSIEDKRYFSHAGIDLRGIARAAMANLSGGGISQGGSTITQQLVKVLYLTPERTLQRKLQEMVLAVALEHQLGKERILELYLNSVYFGSGAWGAPAAAEIYFGHTISELTVAEAATLAASIQAPSDVNLLADPEAVRLRATHVLRLMRDQDRISSEILEVAQAELAVLEARPPPSRAGSYYVDWVLQDAEELSQVVAGRLTMTATIDPVLQRNAERIVAEIMAGPGLAAGATQAAVVAMTPDGHLRAMVGGVDYAESQFNRATDALRQPGSTFKLPVYLAALAMGLGPETLISDAPIEIDGWSPQNYGGGNSGQVTLTEAFARSLNVATVRLAQAIGTENIIAVARQLGIEGPLTDGLSLALGSSEVTLLDMTEAYASILAGRIPVDATGVASMAVGESGTALAVPTNGPDVVQLTATRQPMLDMLRAVVTSGTGQGAELPGFVAGKTGTSQENRDAWFIGFSETLVIGVWVGNDDGSPMRDVTGGGIPVDIWRALMEASQQTPENGAISASAADLTVEAESAPLQCNIRACSRAYRSFQASDCTFQPYRGGRRLCTR